jgi:protein arginine N-methyltransferase 1
LNEIGVEQLSIDAEFTVVSEVAETMHAFVVWFDVLFEGPQKTIALSTSPYRQGTHWSQTVFYLEQPVAVTPGMEISGRFQMHPNPKNPRDQDFLISWVAEDREFSQIFKMR